MSGGVDSSVAAVLLKERGFEVTGVFMKNWSPNSLQSLADCPWEQDQADAAAVCQKISLPFQSINFEKEYRLKVIDYFLKEYRAGRTPNPDIVCNREIKFGIFLAWSLAQGADFVASGHYVRVRTDCNPYQLLRGIDVNKDQSYFLWTLNQNQLRHCLFPIGDLKKTKVRQIARELNLPTAEKKDSQGICFIGAINVGQFLRSEISAQPGSVIGPSNQIIGSHDGAVYYTIGQRHGFRIFNQASDTPPLFVVAKDLEKNIIYVGEENDSRLFTKEIIVGDINWINQLSSDQISAQIRYRQKPIKCQIFPLGQKSVKVKFKSPVKAVALGQSIVFYQEDLVLGGGVIEKIF